MHPSSLRPGICLAAGFIFSAQRVSNPGRAHLVLAEMTHELIFVDNLL